MSTKLDELYIEIKTKVDQLDNQLSQVKDNSTNTAKSIENIFSRTKISIDNQLAKMSLKDVEAMRDKLKAKLDEKIKLNTDMASIDRTRNALNTIESKLKGINDVEVKPKLSGVVSELGLLAGGIIGVSKAFDYMKGAIVKSGDMEGYKTSLKVMLGSADQAQKRLQELIDFAATTPYEIPQVVQLGNQLQAVGRYSKETMTNLGDLASAAGKPLEQVAGAFSKLASGQKGIAVDMFRDMLITTNDWVTATGKGVSKTGELLATTEEMISAIPKILSAKNFNGMMDEQSRTLKGQLSNLSDAAGQLQTAFGDAMAPMIKSVVSGAIPALQGLKGNVDLIIGTVKVLGATFVAYQVVVNGTVVANKALAFWNDVLIVKFNALKAAIASNPLGALAVGLVAVGAAAYELNEAYGNTIENQRKWNEEAQKLNATEQKKLSTLIDSKRKTSDVSQEYERLYNAYVKTKDGSAEHEKAENKLHTILVEQQKLYPDLISNTYDYASGLTKIKDASQQSVTDISKLTTELKNQQIALANLKLAQSDINLDQASKGVFKSMGMFGANSADFNTFSKLDRDLRNGKRPIEDIKNEVAELSSKYASWAVKGGENMQYNIDKATALNNLLVAINEKISAYSAVNSGKGVSALEDPKTNSTTNINTVDQSVIDARNKKIDDTKKYYDQLNGYSAEWEKNYKEWMTKEINTIKKFITDKKALEELELNMSYSFEKEKTDRQKYSSDLDGKIEIPKLKEKTLKDMTPKKLDEVKTGENPMKGTLSNLTKDLEKVQQGTENFANTISSGLIQGITSGENLGRVFTNMAIQLAAMIAQAFIFKGIMSALDLGTGGVGSGLGSIIGALFGHSGGTFYNGQKIAAYANGGSFMVPQGFPNDSYPLLVESGEKVTVTPAGAVGQQEKLLVEVIGSIRAMNKNLMAKSFDTYIETNVDGITFVKKTVKPSENRLNKNSYKLENL